MTKPAFEIETKEVVDVNFAARAPAQARLSQPERLTLRP
jgi:hypothetical protein